MSQGRSEELDLLSPGESSKTVTQKRSSKSRRKKGQSEGNLSKKDRASLSRKDTPPDKSARWELEDYNEIAQEVGMHDYRVIALLGVGSQGRVYLVNLTDTKQYYAMKVFKKVKVLTNEKTVRSILTEQRFLSKNDHPLITKLFHSFHSSERLFLIMEFCPGGELFTMIRKQPGFRLTEEQVRFYASEVISVLEYIHSKGYIYRDLKPENILLQGDGHIRMADFGLSKQSDCKPQIQLFERKEKGRTPFTKKYVLDIQQGEVLRTNSLVGSIHYLAPEVVAGCSYDVMADWWGFGVLLYDMFYGFPPFRGETNREIISAITAGNYYFPEVIPISSDLKSLIKGLLKLDPKKRICAKHGASDLKRHPFFGGIHWPLLRNQTPPLVPQITSPDDISNFELFDEDRDSCVFEFFSEIPEDKARVPAEEQKQFEGFFYISSEMVSSGRLATQKPPRKPSKRASRCLSLDPANQSQLSPNGGHSSPEASTLVKKRGNSHKQKRLRKQSSLKDNHLHALTGMEPIRACKSARLYENAPLKGSSGSSEKSPVCEFSQGSDDDLGLDGLVVSEVPTDSSGASSAGGNGTALKVKRKKSHKQHAQFKSSS